MRTAAGCLPGFEHGRRLAVLLPQGRLVEVDDSYTLLALDQPARLVHSSGSSPPRPEDASCQAQRDAARVRRRRRTVAPRPSARAPVSAVQGAGPVKASVRVGWARAAGWCAAGR